MNPSDESGSNASKLRERLPQNPEKPQKAVSIDTAKNVVSELNNAAAKDDTNGKTKEKRTYGRTPDGTGM
jgi:phosphatidylethanolamine N-methyltransferase